MKRNTWQREAVREALGSGGGFVSAQTLHSDLRSGGSSIGLATVYRALADLAVEGEADSLQSDQGAAPYRACTPGQHHHHLICRHCGRTVEIEADEPVNASVADKCARTAGHMRRHRSHLLTLTLTLTAVVPLGGRPRPSPVPDELRRRIRHRNVALWPSGRSARMCADPTREIQWMTRADK